MSDQPVEFKENFLLQIILIQITYCETHSNDMRKIFFRMKRLTGNLVA